MYGKHRMIKFGILLQWEVNMRYGMYKHYKGGLYRVIVTALHTETEEEMVVYESSETGKVFVRPLDMFNEMVNNKPRFEYLGGAWR